MKHRPQQVQQWIQNARKRNPEIKNLESFVSEFWFWWSGLNPPWRQHDESGKLIINGRGEGPWECLVCLGQNGPISVLACLSWWFGGKGLSDRWKDAVRDVLWALCSMEQSGELRYIRILLMNLTKVSQETKGTTKHGRRYPAVKEGPKV